ncbi:MAG TPA: hypothetical protein VIG50_10955, partial [Vicinamibacteria bacterium]
RGERLRVVAGDATVAEMEVVALYPGTVACRVLSSTRAVVAGDVVLRSARRTAAGAVSPAKAPDVPAPRRTALPSPPPPVRPPTPPPTPAATGAEDPTPHATNGNGNGAPARAATASFRVKYRSSANAYLDGGAPAGLSVGDRLRVAAGQGTAAELEVVHVSEQSSSCRIVSETRPVRVGDVAVRVGAPALVRPAAGGGSAPRAPVVAPTPSPAAALAAPRRGPWARLRGAASVGYARSSDQSAFALGYEQRTARLDVGLYEIAGQPLAFALRLRSREDVRSRALSARTPERERNDRLYELALRYERPADDFGLELGRIGVHRFVGIGSLDGGLARYRVLPLVEVGGFGGREADMYGYTLENPGTKYGAYVRLAPGGRYATGGYEATLALVRELAEGETSREYVSLESRLQRGRWLSVFQRAELDVNRGWRHDATGKAGQLSNVSVSANLRLWASASAFVSYDGRRNYRYQRNRLVPEDLFDGLLYQGLRAGFQLTRPGGFGLSLGGGASLREPDRRHPELSLANAYSANAGLRHANLLGLSVGMDGSAFSNGYTHGGLAYAHAGRRFAGGHFLDLSYGRSLYTVKATGESRVTEWQRLTARAELGRRLYLLADVERTGGDDLDGMRGFAELGIVF